MSFLATQYLPQIDYHQQQVHDEVASARRAQRRLRRARPRPAATGAVRLADTSPAPIVVGGTRDDGARDRRPAQPQRPRRA